MQKQFIIIMFLITLITAALYSQDIITSIEVTGLKRTQPHIVMYQLERFKGKDAAAFDQNEVIAVIKTLGVLEPVSVELEVSDNEIVLCVTVEEKWSLFPFPFFYAGSGETNYGLFLLDANAFGLLDNAIIGGAYSSNGWSAMAMYNHTPDRNGALGFTAVFLYMHQKKEDVDRTEKIIRAYSGSRLFASLGINYDFTDFFACSASLYYSDFSLNKNDLMINPPESGARFIGFTPRFSFNDSSWDGYFLSVRNISLEYSYNFALLGLSYHQIGYRGNYEKALIPGFRLNIKSAGVLWKSSSDPLLEEGPVKAQVNILPKNYSALYYFGFYAGLEKYIVKFNWGTLSVQGSWQCVFSGNKINCLYFDHGPSGGMVFYLSRLALPAIGANIAYNMVSELFQFSFSIGMSL